MRCEWSEHVRGQAPALERRAYRMCKDRHDARDLVQETLERAWRHRARLPTALPPRAWLMRVLTNLYLDRIKRRRIALDPAIRVEELVDEPAPAPRFTAQDARDALAGLPRGLRDVLEAHDLGGLRYREIADRLAIPAGTVGSRLVRARDELRRRLVAVAEP